VGTLYTQGDAPNGTKVAGAGYDENNNKVVVYYDGNRNITTKKRDWDFIDSGGGSNSDTTLTWSDGQFDHYKTNAAGETVAVLTPFIVKAPNSLDPYATSASGSGAPQVKAPDYPVMLGGVGYPTRDAAGIAGSVGAKQHTTAAREFGGEIYSYQENGVTKYGYMAPRPGGANVTQNGNTYHPGPNIKSTNVPYGSTFVGGYHAHYDGQSFSDPDIYAIASKVSNPGGNLGLYVGYDSGFLNNKIRVDVVVATTPAKGGGWNTTTTKVGVIK